VVVY